MEIMESRVKLLEIEIFFKINLFITTLIFLSFIFFLKSDSSLTLIFWFAGALSTPFLLYLVYFVVFRYFFKYRMVVFIISSIFILTDFFLILDFFIFRVWKFHINGMVLNIIFSPTAYKELDMGFAPVVLGVLILFFLLLLEIFLLKFIEKDLKKLNRFDEVFNRFIFPTLILILIMEKIAFGFASLFDKKEILLSSKTIPFYQPLTFNSIAEKYFGFEKKIRNSANFKSKNLSKTLNYPLSNIEIEIETNSSELKNIFIIGIDGFRNDLITPETTPNIYKFAKKSLWFRNNVSGGNATRFGIFTLFYSLNSPYWFNFLDAGKEPIFFDVLKKLNYEIKIYFSTSTKWPEFRQTVFLGVQDKIVDRIDSKDTKTFKVWENYINSIEKDKAIFNFIFLNSPHGRYYPKQFAKFKPDKGGEINYILVKKRDREILLNQYKNAIYYDDYLFGKIIKTLKEQKVYNNSIIILLSDHGEEFYEYGNFGHNTAFSKSQVNSPLIVKLPEQNRGKTIDKLSSSLDLIPSILRYLKVTTPAKYYSNGKSNLFQTNYDRDFTTSGNWNYNAIISDKYTYVFSNLPNKIMQVEKRFTENYKPIKDKNEEEKADSKMRSFIIKTLEENRKFLK